MYRSVTHGRFLVSPKVRHALRYSRYIRRPSCRLCIRTARQRIIIDNRTNTNTILAFFTIFTVLAFDAGYNKKCRPLGYSIELHFTVASGCNRCLGCSYIQVGIVLYGFKKRSVHRIRQIDGSLVDRVCFKIIPYLFIRHFCNRVNELGNCNCHVLTNTDIQVGHIFYALIHQIQCACR